MASKKEQDLEKQLAALRKEYDVEVLNNRIRNYGQEALKWKNAKDAERYKAAKAAQAEAQAKLKEYNAKAKDLITKIQTEQKLTKTGSELEKVTRDRNFYIEAGEDVPADIENKYQKLTKDKTKLETPKKPVDTTPGKVGPKPVGEIPVPAKNAFGPGITPPKTTTSGTKGKKKTTSTTAETGDKEDIKLLWQSYLRTTFAGLEDKTQKAQIDNLLNRAANEKWDEDTFLTALQGTVWWQATLPSIRQFFLDTHDPRNASTFAEKLKNGISALTGKLESLGIKVQDIDPVTGKTVDRTDYLKGIAMKAIENNWTDDQLEQYLATQGVVMFSGGGTLGSYYDKIQQQAYLYGVTLDKNMQAAINTSLLDPMDGRDANYWLNAVKDMAYDAPQNAPFLNSLKSGRNLYEVTNNYREQMANLLEVDGANISWNDLMGKVIDSTTGNARTFADFTKQLKNDPLWQYTKNAKETYSNMALDLGKMFGFVG